VIARVLLLSSLLLLAGLTVGGSGARAASVPLGQFEYSETVVLNNGVGNYSGYTESTAINGSIAVTSVLPNGTYSASYYNANAYQNNQGGQQSWTSSGTFVFSPQSYLYVNRTDNQVGYVNPHVWFVMDSSLPVGATFYLLSTQMTVASTSYNYALETAAGAYVKAIFAEGSSSYPRNDAYGVFTASYDWKAYFDPATGFIIGYVYSEQDSDPTGDGFAITDTLAVTHTNYPLTPGVAPSGSGTNWPLIAAVVVVIVVIVVVIALAISRSRRRRPIPRHSATGQVAYPSPPIGPPPPGISLTPSGQPAVQQIIIKETVKVNCRYCGSLIDSTVEKCPFCGATRT
jgi:outer membrane lipoprotein-sorting protein